MVSSSGLLIIFGVTILLFGPSRLPQLGGAIGECIKNFKDGMKDKNLPPAKDEKS